jgi:biuret amidohydrolase
VTTIEAEPAPLAVNIERTALMIIDMQRDFLLPGGFGAALGTMYRA